MGQEGIDKHGLGSCGEILGFNRGDVKLRINGGSRYGIGGQNIQNFVKRRGEGDLLLRRELNKMECAVSWLLRADRAFNVS